MKWFERGVFAFALPYCVMARSVATRLFSMSVVLFPALRDSLGVVLSISVVVPDVSIVGRKEVFKLLNVGCGSAPILDKTPVSPDPRSCLSQYNFFGSGLEIL